jgi:hypothetical protein
MKGELKNFGLEGGGELGTPPSVAKRGIAGVCSRKVLGESIDHLTPGQTSRWRWNDDAGPDAPVGHEGQAQNRLFVGLDDIAPRGQRVVDTWKPEGMVENQDRLGRSRIHLRVLRCCPSQSGRPDVMAQPHRQAVRRVQLD